MDAALPRNRIGKPADCTLLKSTVAAALLENATNVHEPTDMGLCTLKTRSMCKNRLGTPRSAINKAGETAPPMAAIHCASRARCLSADESLLTRAITAAAPAAPPMKKYKGTSGVHCGGLRSGIP